MRLRRAAVVAAVALALVAPAAARAAGGAAPITPTTIESCTGAACESGQDPADGGPVSTTAPQQENVAGAGYALWGLLAVLFAGIPVAATWQRNVRQRALSASRTSERVRRLRRG
jgi:hypothetical protein